MHRTTLLTAGALLVVAVLARAEDRKDDKDASKLVGTWTVTTEFKGTKEETAADVRGKQVNITRDTITCTDKAGKTDMVCTYELNTSKKPWQVTLNCTEGEYKGKKLLGIAQIEGDTLKLSFSHLTKDFPSEFKAVADSCFFTLKRAEK
jgi:uncharacterized protein (TIGR03067 family)